jgi:DNA (cytosine-5)-methyltransferase 1
MTPTERRALADRLEVMDINWMPRNELAEAIPPAYTKWIGDRMMAHLLKESA